MRSLPLFPLPVFLLPGETIPLYIFEPRYKQLVRDCKTEKISFGIPFVQNEKLLPFGCEVSLQEITGVYDNGTMDITVEALGLFQLKDFHKKVPAKLYSGGNVQEYSLEHEELSKELREGFAGLMRLKHEGFDEKTPGFVHLNTLQIATRIEMSSEKKYQLIQMNQDKQRQVFLVNEIKLLTSILRQHNSNKGKFYLN